VASRFRDFVHLLLEARSALGSPELASDNEARHMNATQQLHNLGQSIWLDNITRDLVNKV